LPVKLPAPAWRFVPESLDPGSLPTIEPLFADLAARPLTAADALERWLVDESELLARIHAEVARRYVRMTCHTDDDDAKKAYLHMEQVVMPRVKVLADQLDRKFLACAALGDLDQRRYEVLIRSRRTKSEIFREENTELQRQEAELQTQQQALMGAITVEFEGETRTLQQLAPFFESQDRALRERAFRAALPRYRMRPYDGRLHLFRPALDRAYVLGPDRVLSSAKQFVYEDNGWTPWVASLDVTEMPGDHDSMVLEPNVRVMAARLRSLLAEVEAEGAAEPVERAAADGEAAR